VTEPTAAALAWRERVDRETAAGVTCGIREICPDCLRPIGNEWGYPEQVPMCRCGTEYRPGNDFRHGLGGLPNGLQSGTITYG